MESKPVTATTSKIVYTLMWDNSTLADDAARERDKARVGRARLLHPADRRADLKFFRNKKSPRHQAGGSCSSGRFQLTG
jgi:hypothetical protein